MQKKISLIRNTVTWSKAPNGGKNQICNILPFFKRFKKMIRKVQLYPESVDSWEPALVTQFDARWSVFGKLPLVPSFDCNYL